MANVTVKNIPNEVYRALQQRATSNGHSIEEEVLHILETAIRPVERIKLGSLLVSIADEAGGLTDAELEDFNPWKTKS